MITCPHIVSGSNLDISVTLIFLRTELCLFCGHMLFFLRNSPRVAVYCFMLEHHSVCGCIPAGLSFMTAWLQRCPLGISDFEPWSLLAMMQAISSSRGGKLYDAAVCANCDAAVCANCVMQRSVQTVRYSGLCKLYDAAVCANCVLQRSVQIVWCSVLCKLCDAAFCANCAMQRSVQTVRCGVLCKLRCSGLCKLFVAAVCANCAMQRSVRTVWYSGLCLPSVRQFLQRYFHLCLVEWKELWTDCSSLYRKCVSRQRNEKLRYNSSNWVEMWLAVFKLSGSYEKRLNFTLRARCNSRPKSCSDWNGRREGMYVRWCAVWSNKRGSVNTILWCVILAFSHMSIYKAPSEEPW